MPCRRQVRSSLAALFAVAFLLLSGGCSVGSTYWPSDEEMAAFEAAARPAVEPEFDDDQLLPAIPHAGPYRVAPGDVLSVSGTNAFHTTVALGGAGGGPSPSAETVVEARVHPDGEWQLPLIDPIVATGMTLDELEDAVVAQVHPRWVPRKPAVVVRVVEPATRKVAVLGAVEKPGIVELTSDQMSLVGALTASGGILKASNLKVGAKRIRLRRPGEVEEENLLLPVRGLNIPFGDVALEGGETIEVERWDPDIFTVIGLVVKPGAYEYPPNREYNLMDALAVAGGTDRIADPPHATAYRKDDAGQILAVTFPLEGDDLTRSSLVPIRPGDVISVQHTIGSWSRSLLAQVLRLQVNFFVDPIRN